jgi:Uma2 family endonuclease
VLTECPIAAADGVKAADVAWASPERVRELGDQVCFTQAPELCVEVKPPGNNEAEIQEKIALYLDAGAQEVWVCAETGAMTFFRRGTPRPVRTSKICPEFAKCVQLR